MVAVSLLAVLCRLGLLAEELGYEVVAVIGEPITVTTSLGVWMHPAIEEGRL